MASSTLSSINPSAKHAWTSEQHVTLAVLWKFYGNPRNQLYTVWNYIYRNSLIAEGFGLNGLPSRRLRAQISEFKKNGTGADTWNTVMGFSISVARKRYRQERERIEDAAQLLDIALILQVHERVEPQGTDLPDVPSKRQKPPLEILIRTKNTSVAYAAPPAQRCPDRRPPSSITWYDASINIRPSPKLRVAFHSDGSYRSGMSPRLLFRAFQPNHNFRARQFLTAEEIPYPPRFRSLQFRKVVKPHLCTDISYDSPFLSLAESPKNALNRIERSPRPLSFAVFDIFELEDDMEERYGARCGPYLVPEICRIHELNDLPKDYYGPGEFLVWGSIECQPAAVLNTREALELISVMESVNAMSPASGNRIGKCLRNVEDEFKELIARKLIKSYDIPGHEKSYNSVEYNIFADAIYAASHGDRASSILSTTVSKSNARESREWPQDEEESTENISVYVQTSRKRRHSSYAYTDEYDDEEMIQALIDVQLAGEGFQYGIEVETYSESDAGEHQAPTAGKSFHNKERQQQSSQNSLSEVIDLTDSKAELIDDDDIDEDIVLISAGRRSRRRAPMSMSKPTPTIRSESSRSTTVS